MFYLPKETYIEPPKWQIKRECDGGMTIDQHVRRTKSYYTAIIKKGLVCKGEYLKDANEIICSIKKRIQMDSLQNKAQRDSKKAFNVTPCYIEKFVLENVTNDLELAKTLSQMIAL